MFSVNLPYPSMRPRFFTNEKHITACLDNSDILSKRSLHFTGYTSIFHARYSSPVTVSQCLEWLALKIRGPLEAVLHEEQATQLYQIEGYA